MRSSVGDLNLNLNTFNPLYGTKRLESEAYKDFIRFEICFSLDHYRTSHTELRVKKKMKWNVMQD